MAIFEKLSRDWIYLKSGAEKAQRGEKLAGFIETLFTVRNVYPYEHLHECDSGEDQPKFVLGRTALGTENNPVVDTTGSNLPPLQGLK